MEKYIATIEGNRIISVFADSIRDAESTIEIQLRGRPGRRDLYTKWIENGKEILCPDNTSIRILPA